MNQAIIPDYLKDIVVFNPDAYNQDREELKAVTNNSHVLNQNKDAYIEGAQVGMYHFPQSRILTNEFRAIVVLRSTGIRAWKGQQFVVTREDNGTLFENQKEIADAIKTVIGNCISTRGVKVDELSTFDIEYLFLNIRGKSVGETVEVMITCPDDGETQVPVFIPLDEIKVQKNPKHNRDIKLDDNLVMRMKYPSLAEFIKTNFVEDGGVGVTESFDLISSCVDQIFNEEESWSGSECSKKELSEFIEQLTSQQFKEI